MPVIKSWRLATIGLLLAAGCTQAQADPDAENLGAEGSFAYLSLTQRASSTPQDVALEAEASRLDLEINAVFVRYYDTTPDAVHTLLDVPVQAPVEGCQLQAEASAAEDHPEAEIELLNAGPLFLQVGAEVRRVYPRTFPELGSLNTGAIYASEEKMELGATRPERYVVFTQGTEDVAEFSLEVPLQAATSVSGISDRLQVGSGEIARSEDLEFSWEPQTLNEALYIDIRSGNTGLRCIATESGKARIPSSLLQMLEPSEAAEVRVFRERRTTVPMQGIDTTEVVLRIEGPAYTAFLE
jgi:hypothetical protein